MLTTAALRAHWRDLAATVLALAIGTAIATASLLVFRSAHPEVPQRFAAAGLIVRGPEAGRDAESFPEYVPWSRRQAAEVMRTLRRQPGVVDAVPVRSFYAQLVIDGRPAGSPDVHDPEGKTWSSAALAPYRTTGGRPPQAGGEVAVSGAYGVRPGERVTLLTGAGERAVTVTGVVDGPGIYLPDDEADEIAAAPTLIGALLSPRTDPDALASRLRAELPAGTTVLAGDDRAGAEPEGVARVRYLGTQLLTLMVLLTCFAAVFVVSQTFTLAASHRRRDVALMRVLGATPKQVRRWTTLEAAALGVIGGVVGAGAGTAGAPVLGRWLVSAGLEPVGFVVTVDPLVLAGVTLLGPLLAVLATRGAGRRAARIPPMAALGIVDGGPARIGVLRLVSGVVAGLGGAAAVAGAAAAEPSAVATPAAGAVLLTVTAVALLAPLVLPPLVRALTAPGVRSIGATGVVVRGAMTSKASRTASTMAPVLVAVAFATLVFGYVETGRGAYGARGLPPGTTAVVAPDATPGLTEDTVVAVREAGAEVEAPLPTQVFTGEPATAAETLGLSAVPSGTAWVSAMLARRNGWTVGDPIRVTTPDGARTSLRISRVVDERTAGPGDGIADSGPQVVLPRAFVRRHDPSALTSRLAIRDVAARRLADVSRPGVYALSPADYGRAVDEDEYRLVRMFVITAVGLSLGYTGLSVVNTVLMATAARRRDLALLRLSGATPGQVRTHLSVEALVTVVIGSMLGFAAGLAGVLGIRAGLQSELGRDVALTFPWMLLAGVVGTCALLAITASLWPGRRTLGHPPVTLAADSGSDS